MLDQPATTDPALDLRVVIHAQLPADWPSARDPGSARCHVFQTREYIESWMATRGAGAGATPYFVEVLDGCGDRVMLLPLCITSRFGEKTLSFMDGGLADYVAPVLFENALLWTEDAARAVWDKVLAALPTTDLVVLQNVPAYVGGQFNPLSLVAGQPNAESAHGSDLTQPWAQLEATQFQLKTIKRKWRALERIGAVRLEVAETDAQVARFLERTLVQKQRRFDETKVSGFDRDPDKLAYFRRATRAFHDAGRLQIVALLVGDEIVATAWNLVLGRRVYEILIGFEGGEWVKYSCGRILNLMQLEWLKQQGFDYLDHGIGDESWKLEYCDTHVPLGQSVEFRSLRGRWMVTRKRLRERLRSMKAWQRLQPLKWALLRRTAPGID
jgi:CelD/BcsL family acetyltransferase involved in cellulose biosynthesis